MSNVPDGLKHLKCLDDNVILWKDKVSDEYNQLRVAGFGVFADDSTGLVISTGDDVDNFEPGDRVIHKASNSCLDSLEEDDWKKISQKAYEWKNFMTGKRDDQPKGGWHYYRIYTSVVLENECHYTEWEIGGYKLWFLKAYDIVARVEENNE